MFDETQPVFNDPTVDIITDKTGIIDDRPILSLDTDDRQLIANFNRWVTDTKSYWNDRSGYDLQNVRNRNERYYLGKQIDKSRLYDYQVPYQDNEIFVGTQAVMAYVTASEPSCEVIPDNDQPQSMVMAQDLEQAVNIHTERWNLSSKVKAAVKNMYIKRLGVIKLVWDDKANDIKPIAVDPERLILDKDCQLGEEPKFICETCTCSVAALMKSSPKRNRLLCNA
jgi:hypothetical protein